VTSDDVREGTATPVLTLYLESAVTTPSSSRPTETKLRGCATSRRTIQHDYHDKVVWWPPLVQACPSAMPASAPPTLSRWRSTLEVLH
jgi:hypothetical protein